MGEEWGSNNRISHNWPNSIQFIGMTSGILRLNWRPLCNLIINLSDGIHWVSIDVDVYPIQVGILNHSLAKYMGVISSS